MEMENETRLATGIEAMKEFFPDFSLSFQQNDSKCQAMWLGWVQPIQSADGLIELLDDIHQERPVHVMPGGEIRHKSSCIAIHQQYEWMNRLQGLRVSYELKVLYSGGRAHPKAFVRNLRIPPHGSNHIFQDGSICAYAPWQNVWRWNDDTVVEYLGQVLVWLIKWTIWCQAKVWIGTEVSHYPSELLQSIDRNDECWCGSGKRYKKCHLANDFNRSRGGSL